MAVQAQQQHAFHHDLHSYRALDDGTAGASLFFDERGGCAPAVAGIADTAVLSDLTCNNNYAFVPRKRARVAAAEAPGFVVELEQPRGARTPAVPQGFVPDGDMLSRAMGSGAASTSGRIGNAAGVPRLFHFHPGMEIDALVRIETERMRACLEEAARRHVRALVAAAERAAAGRLRAAESALELARGRTAELEERLRQTIAEGQAWMGVARSDEAVAAGLRGTLGQLLIQSPASCAAPAGECDDARSCCFETPACADDDGAASTKASAARCRACGEGGACVLLLPCRHLCLCRACDAAVDTCPVCAAAKNASFHVLLS